MLVLGRSAGCVQRPRPYRGTAAAIHFERGPASTLDQNADCNHMPIRQRSHPVVLGKGCRRWQTAAVLMRIGGLLPDNARVALASAARLRETRLVGRAGPVLTAWSRIWGPGARERRRRQRPLGHVLASLGSHSLGEAVSWPRGWLLIWPRRLPPAAYV